MCRLSLSSGCHWRILNVQEVTNLFSKCSGCHWPLLNFQDALYRYLISKWPPLSLSFVNVFRLPMCCLQIAQAAIDLFSECSGCHWRISNQDVTNLFSKCSGCHCPSSMFRLPMSCLQIAQAVIDLSCPVFKLRKLSLTYPHNVHYLWPVLKMVRLSLTNLKSEKTLNRLSSKCTCAVNCLSSKCPVCPTNARALNAKCPGRQNVFFFLL